MNNLLYAFVHVPRTGGTLFKHNLSNYLCKDINNQHCQASYFEKHNHKHIYMTILRDPYDRACSEYFYFKKYYKNKICPKHEIGFSIDYCCCKYDWSKESIDFFLENYLTETHLLDKKYNESIYSHLYDSINILDFDFIGCTEQMNESIILFDKMFKIKIKNEHININNLKNVEEKYIARYSRADFKKKHEKDYEIYYLAKEIFNKRCRSNNVLL